MTYGRMELAQRYFPAICGRAAWAKLKGLLMECPHLAPLATMSRRTLTPAEVETVYDVLGEP